MAEKIFFQSSLPRSGSTVFQNILAQNPDFYATPTSGLLDLLYAARVNYTNSAEFKAQDAQQMEKAWRNFCLHGMLGYFNALTDKKYVIDKCRGWGVHYDFLNFFYPNPKIICVIRNPIDIFCSMEKKFRANQHKDSGLVDHVKMEGTATEKRVDIWSRTPPVGLALERLAEMVRQGIHKKVLIVRFEHLCRNPQAEMNRVYEYMEIEAYTHDFDNIAQTTQEDDVMYGFFGDHIIKPKLSLPPSDAMQVLGADICQWLYQKYQWVEKL